MHYIREYEQRLGTSREALSHIYGEVLRLNELTHDLPVMDDAAILATEIPEGENFVQVRCMYNGRPSLIRVVNNRGEIGMVVDYQWDVSEIRERIQSLALLLGRIELGMYGSNWA